jgi:hypothetical protein
VWVFELPDGASFNLNFPRFFEALLQLYSRGILKGSGKNSKVNEY